MKKSVIFNYSLSKIAGGAMSKFSYSKPSFERSGLRRVVL